MMIQDYKIAKTSGDEGVTEHVTPVINGFLEGFIITTSQNVVFEASLVDYPSVVIYRNVNQGSQVFIPIRREVLNADGKQFNYQADKIPLNDRLKITIRGAANTRTEVVVRWGE